MKKLYKSYSFKLLELSVHALYALLLIPILLQLWDLQVYGKWIAIYSFFNLLKVFEFGHSKYIGNIFNKEAPINPTLAKEALGSAFWGNLLIQGAQILVLLLIYSTGILALVLDADIRTDHMIVVLSILLAYRILMGSFRGLVVKILNPFGLIYKSFQYSLFERILEFALLVFAAMFGFSLISLAILWFISKLIFSALILMQLRKEIPEYFPWWRHASFKVGYRNARKSLSFAASTFMDRFMDDGIQLVVSAVLGTTFLPLFKATKALVNLGSKVSDLLLNPILPNIINLYVREKFHRILDVFRSYWLFSGMLLFSGYGISLLCIDDFFKIWTQGKLAFSFTLFAGLVAVQLLKVYGAVSFNFFSGINKTGIVFSTSVLRVIVFFGCFLLFDFSPLINIISGLIIAEGVIALIWLPYFLQSTVILTAREKLQYYNGGVCLLLFCILLYLYHKQAIVFSYIPFAIGILILWYYQYRTISASSKKLVTNSMAKLRTFVFKF